MKQNDLIPNFYHILPILFICILLSSCIENDIFVFVDNPTIEEIKVSFDNGYSTYIDPYQQKLLTFPPGSYSVSLNGGTQNSFTIEPDSEYLLNPTGGDYYIEEVGYGELGTVGNRIFKENNPSQKENLKDLIPLQSVKVDSLEYTGYVHKTQDLAIKKTWKYGIWDKLPKSIKVSLNSIPGTKTKIFRKSQFIKFHKLH